MNLSPSDIQRIEKQFDHFCKLVLSNESKDIKRHCVYQIQNEKCFCELTPDEEKQLYVEDKYAIFDMEMPVLNFIVHIHNELLYEAILALAEQKRNILILHYWLDMTDQQIAEELHLPRSTVNCVRTSSIKKLRKLMEVQKL
jgi:RNA polymerase sigma factor (sigma-70 family)